MAGNLSYIRLQSTNESQGSTNLFRFRVIFGSLKHAVQRMQTRQRTLGGASDVQEGPQYGIWSMTVRVVNDSTDPEDDRYGTLSDLQTMFAANESSGANVNTFRFWDNANNNADNSTPTATVQFVGEYSDAVVTPLVYGNTSWYMVQLVLEEV